MFAKSEPDDCVKKIVITIFNITIRKDNHF